MLFLFWDLYSNAISEKTKTKGACCLFPAHSNQQMSWWYHIGISSLAGYIMEAMNQPLFGLAFIMVKESFVIPTIFFYLASAAIKDRVGGDHL